MRFADKNSAESSLLDTRYRNDQLAVRSSEDREIEHAVLARAHQLLAIDQQHPAAGIVLESKLGHTAAFGDLRDPSDTLLQCLVEGQVVRHQTGWCEKRENGQTAESGRLAQRDIGKRFGMSEEPYARIVQGPNPWELVDRPARGRWWQRRRGEAWLMDSRG